MKSHYNASDARSNLFNLIDEVASTHKPVYINGKRNSVVLVAEEDWDSMNETMYLLSIPGMKESLLAGEKETNCSTKRPW